MKEDFIYDTVSEALNDLFVRGYTTEFDIHSDEGHLICNNELKTELSPDEFEIDETYRFEGSTDPGDEMIVIAISSLKNNIKGTLVSAFGTYTDEATSKIFDKIKKHP